MGGFAQIPQIGETVPTPTIPNRPRPPLLNVPEIVNPIAEGLRGAVRAGESLNRIGDILAVQARHKNILDADAAEERYKDQIAKVYADAKQLPGDQWASTVQQQGNEISQKMIGDPANAHISGYLQQRLPAIQGSIYRDALMAGTAQTAREQDTQLKALGTKLAGAAGGDFGVAQDGSITEGPESVAARTKYAGMIDQMWPKNPQAAAFYKQQFEDQATVERAQALARNHCSLILELLLVERRRKQQFEDQATVERAQALARNPDAAHPALLQDFIKANPGKFTPQQESSLLSAQTTAIGQPMRAMEANAA